MFKLIVINDLMSICYISAISSLLERFFLKRAIVQTVLGMRYMTFDVFSQKIIEIAEIVLLDEN